MSNRNAEYNECGNKGLYVLCAVCSIILIVVAISVGDLVLNPLNTEVLDACYELEGAINRSIDRPSCVEYLEANPTATGQEVLNHLGVKTADEILSNPLLRDT